MSLCKLVITAVPPSPVSDAGGCVHGEESQKLFVKNLVDAAFPGQEQLGKATEFGICNSGGVGDRHQEPRISRSPEWKRCLGKDPVSNLISFICPHQSSYTFRKVWNLISVFSRFGIHRIHYSHIPLSKCRVPCTSFVCFLPFFIYLLCTLFLALPAFLTYCSTPSPSF